jgi:hypothetical protein
MEPVEIKPLDEYVRVYHVGLHGCMKLALLFHHKPMPREPLQSRFARNPDGSSVDALGRIRCGACGVPIGTPADLSYEKPRRQLSPAGGRAKKTNARKKAYAAQQNTVVDRIEEEVRN